MRGIPPPAANVLAVRRLLGLLAAAAVVTPAAVAVASPTHLPHHGFRADGVTASVDAGVATISNGLVGRTWSLGTDGSVRTTRLTAGDGHDWAAPGADFELDV